MTHDDLCLDLARTRRDVGDIAGTEVSLGPWMERGRADVLSMRPSWFEPCPTVWEVKVSRADYLSDIRAEKWRKYLEFCARMYFAVPRGLVGADEVPEGVGLCYRGPNGWYTVRAPRLRRDVNWRRAAMALLLHYHPSPWQIPHPDRLERLRMIREGRRTAYELGQEIAAIMAVR